MWKREGFFLASLLLILLAVPLGQHFLRGGSVAFRPGPFAPFAGRLAELPSAGGPLDAERILQAAMDELERGLEDESVLMEWALPGVQWLLAGWGGAGNEETHIGYRGWLFYRPGFDYLTGVPFLDPAVIERRRRTAKSWRRPPAPDPRPALLDLHRQLAERGIELLLVPAPSKAMIHPELFAPALDLTEAAPPLHNLSFPALRRELEASGLRVFDPSGTLRRLRREGVQTFLRTDSHWSPAAVDAVAAELAARVRLLDLPFARPETGWRGETRETEGLGDLALTLKLPAWGDLYPPERVRVERVIGTSGEPWKSDRRAEVLLLGDSFTNVFSDPGLRFGSGAGLAEQLAHHLGRAVDRVALNNAGAWSSRERLARELLEDPRRLNGKQVVIFEFAVRELAIGDWRLIDLPAEPSPLTDHPPAVDGHPIRTVLPPDAIPALDDPPFVPADRTHFVDDDEKVLGVRVGRESRAYAISQLDWHEVVNDRLGGSAVAVTW